PPRPRPRSRPRPRPRSFRGFEDEDEDENEDEFLRAATVSTKQPNISTSSRRWLPTLDSICPGPGVELNHARETALVVSPAAAAGRTAGPGVLPPVAAATGSLFHVRRDRRRALR